MQNLEEHLKKMVVKVLLKLKIMAQMYGITDFGKNSNGQTSKTKSKQRLGQEQCQLLSEIRICSDPEKFRIVMIQGC